MIRNYLILLTILLFVSGRITGQEHDLETALTKVMDQFEEEIVIYDLEGNYSDKRADNFLMLFSGTDVQLADLFGEKTSYKKYVSPVDYVNDIREHFPSGFRIDLNHKADSILSPVRKDRGAYMVALPVQLKLIGLRVDREDKQFINRDENLYFMIQYRKQGGVIAEMKIASLLHHRPELSNYAKPPRKTIFSLEVVPEIAKLSYSGGDELDAFTASYNPGYQLSMAVSFPVSRTIYLFGGAGIGSLAGNMSWSYASGFDESMPYEDIDGDQYFLGIACENTEKYTLDMLVFPAGLSYKLLPGRKSHLLVSAGLNTCYILNQEALVDGQYETTGYYPEYHIVLYDIPHYGFMTEEYQDRQMVFDPGKVLLAASVEIAYRFRFGNKSNTGLDILVRAEKLVNRMVYDEGRYPYDYYSIFREGLEMDVVSFGAGLRMVF